VVVAAMATATAVGTMAKMVAAAVAKTTAATARQRRRRQRVSYAGFIKFYLFKYRTRQVEVITIQFVNPI
jgi:hypothetical protein